jgi:hypothetical protein
MDKIAEDSLGHKILSRPTIHEVNFDITSEVLKLEKSHVSNYFRNPEKNWGPKRAAAIVIPRESVLERTERQDRENAESEEKKLIREENTEVANGEKMNEEKATD